MTEEEFDQLQRAYQKTIIDFLQQQRETLSSSGGPAYEMLQQKIKTIEKTVRTVFHTEQKEIKSPPQADTKPLPKETADIPHTDEIPTVIYPEKNKPSLPVLVEKLSISLFLTIQKDGQKLSIPISYFAKKSKEDIVAFLTIYSDSLNIGFGLMYNGLPWNVGKDGQSYRFESALIGVWFEGVKKILQGDEQVKIGYWKGSVAYIQRLNPTYILLEDQGFAPVIQVALDDFLPGFLTACIEYLSFLNKVQPLIEQGLKQNKESKLNPSIIYDLDMPTFRKRVRHLRRNLYSSSFF